MNYDHRTRDDHRSSGKRKKPDDEVHQSTVRPLRENPIDNEYEDLSAAEVSDEEEIRPRLGRGEMEQIERAQEASTVSDIGGIKITPFNLEEELEEGEFDEAGNFLFKRRRNSGSDGEEIDTWADTVDWEEVKHREDAARAGARSSTKNAQNSPEQQVSDRPKDEISCYRVMLQLMQPNEVVKKTIQRLGDAIPKRKPINKNKRSQGEGATIDQASIEEMRRNLDLMIELAHQRFEEGDMDIYQKSYDEIEEAVNV